VELDAVAGSQPEGLDPILVVRQLNGSARQLGDTIRMGLKCRHRRVDPGKQRTVAALVDRSVADLILAHIDDPPPEGLGEKLVAPTHPEHRHVRPLCGASPRGQLVNPVVIVVDRCLGATDDDGVVASITPAGCRRTLTLAGLVDRCLGVDLPGQISSGRCVADRGVDDGDAWFHSYVFVVKYYCSSGHWRCFAPTERAQDSSSVAVWLISPYFSSNSWISWPVWAYQSLRSRCISSAIAPGSTGTYTW